MLAPFTRRPIGAQDESAVHAQLRDLKRQGASMASLAHVCAGALVLLFSLGSLISLSAAAFYTVLAGLARGRLDVPAAISVAVSTLLVCAMDIAMLYAASVLRVLSSRGASGRERLAHVSVMISACVLEASTYLYMTWLYDRPTNAVVWLLNISRALAAPLYATYLSMARPLPVTPRDIFAQAELASGEGVLEDVTTLAHDTSAPLRKKLRIFGASSRMREPEREQLGALIDAVSEDAPDAPALLPAPGARQELAPIGAALALDASASSPDDNDTPPTPPTRPRGTRGRGASSSRLDARSGAPVLVYTSDATGTAQRARADAGRTRAQQEALWKRDTDMAARILRAAPDISTRELARRLSDGRPSVCHPQRAQTVRRALTHDAPAPRSAHIETSSPRSSRASSSRRNASRASA